MGCYLDLNFNLYDIFYPSGPTQIAEGVPGTIVASVCVDYVCLAVTIHCNDKMSLYSLCRPDLRSRGPTYCVCPSFFPSFFLSAKISSELVLRNYWPDYQD